MAKKNKSDNHDSSFLSFTVTTDTCDIDSQAVAIGIGNDKIQAFKMMYAELKENISLEELEKYDIYHLLMNQRSQIHSDNKIAGLKWQLTFKKAQLEWKILRHEAVFIEDYKERCKIIYNDASEILVEIVLDDRDKTSYYDFDLPELSRLGIVIDHARALISSQVNCFFYLDKFKDFAQKKAS
ncbi:MAG: hypothetical protein EOP06_04030 [Proteobacteria bacterium]|nr:MAG: hypothetical protein EOP06_04030 [Pseudomonadota bacterium]